MKLLVPLDRSPRDGVIVPYVVELGRCLQAGLVFVHCVSALRSVLPGSLRPAEAYMDGVAESVRAEGLDAEAVIGRGDPALQILELALDLPADLIVMVTRRAQGVGKLMFGSVAAAVIARSPVPVLLLTDEMAASMVMREKDDSTVVAA